MFYLLLLTLVVPVVVDHAEENPVYAQLVEKGLEIEDQKIPFVQPSMPDGLSMAAQKKIITEIGGDAYDYDSLIRKSTVAPHIMQTDLVEKGSLRYGNEPYPFHANGFGRKG